MKDDLLQFATALECSYSDSFDDTGYFNNTILRDSFIIPFDQCSIAVNHDPLGEFGFWVYFSSYLEHGADVVYHLFAFREGDVWHFAW